MRDMSKYQKFYDMIIKRGQGRRLDGYYETHHIVPRAIGGTDAPTNLVDLTYREHFLAHWLLTKIVVSKKHRAAMINAFRCMTRGSRPISGWQFEVARRQSGTWRRAQTLPRKENYAVPKIIHRPRIKDNSGDVMMRSYEEMLSYLLTFSDPASIGGSDRAKTALQRLLGK